MNTDYDERQQRQESIQHYCEHIQRVCAELDHSDTERPHGLLHEPDRAYEVMRREVREAGL